MNMNIRENSSIPVIDIEGRLDAHEAPVLSKALDDLHGTTQFVVVNATEVHFIDSTGLAILASRAKRFRDDNGDLILCGLQKPVQIIFELTRLDSVFNIANTEEDAIHTAQGSAQPEMVEAY